MDTAALSLLLLRCAGVNYALLLLAFVAWGGMGGRLHALYSRAFRIDRGRFDAVVLVLIGVYKIGIVLVFLVPGLVLRYFMS